MCNALYQQRMRRIWLCISLLPPPGTGGEWDEERTLTFSVVLDFEHISGSQNPVV